MCSQRLLKNPIGGRFYVYHLARPYIIAIMVLQVFLLSHTFLLTPSMESITDMRRDEVFQEGQAQTPLLLKPVDVNVPHLSCIFKVHVAMLYNFFVPTQITPQSLYLQKDITQLVEFPDSYGQFQLLTATDNQECSVTRCVVTMNLLELVKVVIQA